MSLSPDLRQEFQALLPALGDDSDPSSATRFAAVHRESLLEELVATPGVEKIRAGVLRLLVDLVPEASERAAWLSKAGSALMVPPSPHPVDRLARHPAWIGLATLELADQQVDWEGDPVDRALQLAARGFQVVGDLGDFGDGEVLWALAEEAEQVRWSSRAHELLERAVTATFISEERQAEVELLTGMRRHGRGEDGTDLLERAAGRDGANDRTRTHAAWILAHSQSDPEAQLRWLTRASEWVDREEDPGVAAQIDEALSERHRT
ncbi:MAG: hypothetical protein AB8H79_15550 [Myxococcota bacterium]